MCTCESTEQSKLTGAVGFDSLPLQLTAKTLKRPFEFNLILVGRVKILGRERASWVRTAADVRKRGAPLRCGGQARAAWASRPL